MAAPPAESRPPALVFVTRRYPPSVGGMQTLAHSIWRALEQLGPVILIALGRSQKHLAWFLPYAAIRTRHAVRTERVDRLVFGDALAYAMIRPLLPRSAPPCTVMVMGLDLTFPSRPYRAMVRSALRSADRIVAISHSTATIAEGMGVDPARCVVLNPGVEPDESWSGTRDEAAATLRRRYGLADDCRLLVNVGRLVRRKGIQWFVEHVMPQLPDPTALLLAGSGPEENAIRETVGALGLERRVHLLGHVDDETRALLIAGGDVFVMPNVPVRGDVEGFGLVAVEASNAGLLVVAARLEGIVDAVVDGTTGYLCEPMNADEWRDRLSSLLDDPHSTRASAERFANESRRRSSFDRMSRDLPEAFGIDRPTNVGDSPASGTAP
jgi:phosphatidyl-myo-inositol dimannoside synthase